MLHEFVAVPAALEHSRFDSAEDDRRAEEVAKRRRRTILVIVLVATLLPLAVCGLLAGACALMLG